MRSFWAIAPTAQVAAGALNYFDKSMDELTIAEAALLAGLPKAPSSYDPIEHPDAALARRDYVLTRMRDDGIRRAHAGRGHSRPSRAHCPAQALGDPDRAEADFFIEEVRRQLVVRLGEQGFYRGWPFGSKSPSLRPCRPAADQALRHGLATYDRRQGWRGPWGTLDVAAAGDAWQQQLMGLDPGFELGDWRRGVVLRNTGGRVEIGLDNGERVPFSGDDAAWSKGQPLAVGDTVVIEETRRARYSPLGTAPAPERGRCRRSARTAHRPRAGDERRLQLPPEQIQPRDRGPPSAGLLLQAVRLSGGRLNWAWLPQ